MSKRTWIILGRMAKQALVVAGLLCLIVLYFALTRLVLSLLGITQDWLVWLLVTGGSMMGSLVFAHWYDHVASRYDREQARVARRSDVR